jgi:hypothetical protein
MSKIKCFIYNVVSVMMWDYYFVSHNSDLWKPWKTFCYTHAMLIEIHSLVAKPDKIKSEF